MEGGKSPTQPSPPGEASYLLGKVRKAWPLMRPLSRRKRRGGLSFSWKRENKGSRSFTVALRDRFFTYST